MIGMGKFIVDIYVSKLKKKNYKIKTEKLKHHIILLKQIKRDLNSNGE